jgi:pimeloyl-ACP methyl ester carboxylesterase
MKRWPVAWAEFDVPTRFGNTHVVASGPQAAPPLVLLHGYMATSVMWAPNIAALSADHRVYAIDVMGQPGKSRPDQPIRDVGDYVEWLTAVLDGLRLDRVALLGMSFGGWLALSYAVAMPERVEKLVLLSPGGLLPMSTQFKLRGMLMALVPTRFTVSSFMRWLGFSDRPGENDARPVLDLMYLGMKHVRMPPETLRVVPQPLSDDALRAVRMPVLLLMGADDVICNAAEALARARRLIPHLEAALVPGCKHDMCFSQHEAVEARIHAFLAPIGRPPAIAPSAQRRRRAARSLEQALAAEVDCSLVPECDPKNADVITGLADDLQSDWKPPAIEAAWHVHGGQAVEVGEHRQVR